MAPKYFQVFEHRVLSTYVREYPGAAVINQEDDLYQPVKQYIVLQAPQSRLPHVTVIACASAGTPKEAYEPIWETLYEQSTGLGFTIGSIWIGGSYIPQVYPQAARVMAISLQSRGSGCQMAKLCQLGPALSPAILEHGLKELPGPNLLSDNTNDEAPVAFVTCVAQEIHFMGRRPMCQRQADGTLKLIVMQHQISTRYMLRTLSIAIKCAQHGIGYQSCGHQPSSLLEKDHTCLGTRCWKVSNCVGLVESAQGFKVVAFMTSR